MSEERVAVYAGSFDPVTNGHIHILQQARTVFDIVHVLVAANPEKARSAAMTPEERITVFEWFVDFWAKAESGGVLYAPVRTAILPPGELTVEYAHRVGASFLVRGLRNGMDFAYEQWLQFEHTRLADELRIHAPTTWYVGSSLGTDIYTSSTLVRGYLSSPRWREAIRGLVPGITLALMEAARGNRD